jgi:hypothetical protein
MSFIFSFPFCGISDLGNTKSITGTVTVKSITHGILVSQTVLLDAMNWNNNSPASCIKIAVDDLLYTNVPLDFEITVSVTEPNCLFLFFQPAVISPNTLHYEIVPKNNQWINVPLTDSQTHACQFNVVICETVDTVISQLADTVEYRNQLTYVERPTVVFDIDYYLGKDTFKNLYFNKKIPAMWDIPARTTNFTDNVFSNKTIVQPDGIEYRYNNLGYRSNFDYTDELQNKKVILCLGDSDLFGAGIEYKDIWSTQLQELLGNEYTVMNMGIQGASADAIARIGVSTMGALPNIVATLVQWPHTSLREFVSKKYKGGVHTHRNYNLPYADWWDHIDWQSNNYNYNKNKILLEHTSAKYNIQYHDLYINRDDPKVPYDFVEFGIYSCIGPKTSRGVANYFNKKLDK